jgi:hypothetical protein
MDKYYPDGDKTNANNLYGYVQSEAMLQVLKQCRDNLTRENVMKQAANLKNFHSDLMLPGIMVNTGPDDYFPIEQMQLMRFNGEAWELFGDVITGEVGKLKILKRRRHGVAPLRRHYPGMSGSTSSASWASDCCQPR